MYNKRFNYVLVGCFVLAMAMAGIVSIAVLTGRTGPTDSYAVRLDNVADIKYGTQVRFEGFPIGQVERIGPARPGGLDSDRPGRFRVEISVREGWRIPADSVARIGSSSFLGAKTLDIESGASEQSVALGEEILSAPPADMFTAMQVAASQLTAMSEGSIKPLLQSLQTLAGTVNRDTPRITRELASFAERLNTVLEPVQSLLADANVQTVRRILVNTEGTTETLARASQDLAGAMRQLDQVTANLNSMVEANDSEIEQTLKDLRYTLASVARSVDTIVHNFDGTARNMNEFSRLIRSNPGVLLGSTPREAVSEAKATRPKDTQE